MTTLVNTVKKKDAKMIVLAMECVSKENVFASIHLQENYVLRNYANSLARMAEHVKMDYACVLMDSPEKTVVKNFVLRIATIMEFVSMENAFVQPISSASSAKLKPVPTTVSVKETAIKESANVNLAILDPPVKSLNVLMIAAKEDFVITNQENAFVNLDLKEPDANIPPVLMIAAEMENVFQENAIVRVDSPIVTVRKLLAKTIATATVSVSINVVYANLTLRVLHAIMKSKTKKKLNATPYVPEFAAKNVLLANPLATYLAPKTVFSSVFLKLEKINVFFIIILF